MRCKEYRVMSGDQPLDERVEADISAWEKENLGTLDVAAIHPFMKGYDMQPDTAATWVLVTFSFTGATSLEIGMRQAGLTPA